MSEKVTGNIESRIWDYSTISTVRNSEQRYERAVVTTLHFGIKFFAFLSFFLHLVILIQLSLSAKNRVFRRLDQTICIFRQVRILEILKSDRGRESEIPRLQLARITSSAHNSRTLFSVPVERAWRAVTIAARARRRRRRCWSPRRPVRA